MPYASDCKSLCRSAGKSSCLQLLRRAVLDPAPKPLAKNPGEDRCAWATPIASMTRASATAFCGRRRNRVIVVKYPKQA